jgi:hypothetical protein
MNMHQQNQRLINSIYSVQYSSFQHKQNIEILCNICLTSSENRVIFDNIYLKSVFKKCGK